MSKRTDYADQQVHKGNIRAVVILILVMTIFVFMLAFIFSCNSKPIPARASAGVFILRKLQN